MTKLPHCNSTQNWRVPGTDNGMQCTGAAWCITAFYLHVVSDIRKLHNTLYPSNLKSRNRISIKPDEVKTIIPIYVYTYVYHLKMFDIRKLYNVLYPTKHTYLANCLSFELCTDTEIV